MRWGLIQQEQGRGEGRVEEVQPEVSQELALDYVGEEGGKRAGRGSDGLL